MAVRSTLPKALTTFTLGSKVFPSSDTQQKLYKLFRLNFALDEFFNQLNSIRSEVSELNVTVSNNEIQQELANFINKFDPNAKDTLYDEFKNYSYEFLKQLKADYDVVKDDYESEYANFLESFFSNDELKMTRYIDTPFSEFSRKDLIRQLQSFNLEKSLLDSFKSIKYEAYPDQILYLFYITTSSNNPPRSLSDIQTKLNNIKQFCDKNLPKMNLSTLSFDQSTLNELNKLNEGCCKAIDKLNKIRTSVEGMEDDNKGNLLLQKIPEDKTLVLPKFTK